MRSIGVIDVGSNAVRAAIVHCSGAGETQTQETRREAIRLGRDAFRTRKIGTELTEQLVEAFRHFGEWFGEQHVEAVRAVGTSALRDAVNGADVVAEVLRVTGITIEIISGEEEARLVYDAVRSRVDLSAKDALLIEIGGGSVEVSVVRQGKLVWSDAVKMGTVRLLELLDGARHSAKVFSRMVREYSRGVRQSLKAEASVSGQFDVCVATGGNCEDLGVLRRQILGKDTADELSRAELESLISKLQELDIDERITKLGLRPDRADVILPAALVLLEILEVADVKRVLLPGVGLRDGVALELGGTEKTDPRQRGASLCAYAMFLGQRYRFDEDHGMTVAKHALALFDQLAELHRLPEAYRTLLEIASLLHDIGQHVSYRSHHKHSCYLLAETPFVGLSKRERLIVACVARYHRKSAPSTDHEPFASLEARDQSAVRRLAALIRVADALDRGHAGAVRSITCRVTKKEVRIAAEGRGELELERWAVTEKARLFEDVFDRRVVLEA